MLSIAGSDPSGGAGIGADLKTFQAHGVYGMAVVTALTAQNTRRVRWVQPVGPGGVSAQIRAVLEDMPVHGVKIGMLGDAAVTRAVVRALEALEVPIVLDPVLGSSTGAPLNEDPSALMELAQMATLVTPNQLELEALPWLVELDTSVLITGGHSEGDVLVERLVGPGGDREWEHPRIDTRNLHGTGCTLSSAIAARLALGEELEDAIDGALRWTTECIARSAGHSLGGGEGPLLHGLLAPRRPE
ncbi:MAG TPA: hydroxymethylpyrimidine/phosphomethylpyrimidine kinase [Myxococcota bacterium]|nr:hydroxymethylpyrimidine/phosphomethylpyrimidine kinase [Myxococcota bacterium]